MAKDSVEMLTATHSPWGLKQAASFGWPLLCQAWVGTGVNRADVHKTDPSVGVTAFFADNITARMVCWGGSWSLIPHSRANVTWMKLAKKLWESTVTRQVTVMNIFFTKKWQLFLHPWDLCLLSLQATEWTFTFWYSSRVHYNGMTETRELSWIWLNLMYRKHENMKPKESWNWRGISSTSSSF